MGSDWIVTHRLNLPPDAAFVPMQQHPTYGAACAMLGSGVRRFALRNAGGVWCASAQVLVRRWPLLGAAALLSRGPVWSPDVPVEQQASGLLALLDRLRAEHRCVLVTPEASDTGDLMSGSSWLAILRPCHLASLTLDASPDQMRAEMHGKWRNRLVRAGRSELEIIDTPMPPDSDHWLLLREQTQARNRGYRNLSPGFTTAWQRAGGEGSARLFTARLGNQVVAAMLFLIHGAAASYHIGWSELEGRACGAHNLLLWRAMTWLSERGIRQLCLDLLDTERAPGLARFKLGSGARVVRLGATRMHAPGSRLFAAAQ